MSGFDKDSEELRKYKVDLITKILEFDPSDDYHEFGHPGYHDAIDRVVQLIYGNIDDWTSPPPFELNPYLET